jgi:CrcB protein
MWQRLFMVAIGGALGAIARYGLSGLVSNFASERFPWGTFAVNALGCFAFGLLAPAALERAALSPTMRLLVFTGFLGAFTTFSTYGFETAQLMRDAQWAGAGWNVVGQNLVGVALVLVGMKLGQALV